MLDGATALCRVASSGLDFLDQPWGRCWQACLDTDYAPGRARASSEDALWRGLAVRSMLGLAGAASARTCSLGRPRFLCGRGTMPSRTLRFGRTAASFDSAIPKY